MLLRAHTGFVLMALLLCCSVAASGAHAASRDVLSYDDARHLLARTGFGPNDTEVRAYVGLTRAQAVQRLLDGARTTAVTPLPASIADATTWRSPPGPNGSPEERKVFQREQVREGLQLRAWWVQEMLSTPSPLTERMTLFWHNHFVSAQPKVRLTRLMAVQNATLRAHALGNFGTLLHAIAKDPAMLVYLDAAQSRRGTPNENFAREVMELFTLGEGRYTEADIKEAARAFTGWSIDRSTGRFIVRPGLRDDGDKTIFGKTARFDGDDVLDLLLARPETAQLVVTKLWREFVSPEPDARAVARIARTFRDSQYDIRSALHDLLMSDAFWSADHRGVLVKSPAEMVVGTLRQLDLHPADTMPFAVAMAGMGQNLFSPPNVKGWPGGEAWINTSTLLMRKQFVERLTRGDDTAAAIMARAMSPEDGNADAMRPVPRQVLQPNGVADEDKLRAQRFARAMQRGLASVQFDSARWMARLPGDSAATRNQSAERLLLATAPQQPLDTTADSLGFVRSALLDAAFQLK